MATARKARGVRGVAGWDGASDVDEAAGAGIVRSRMHGPAPARRFPRDLPSPVPPHPADAALTPERARLYRQVLARRTRRLAVVVEDCHDPHNATAVLRTCDAFGVHRVHVVAGRNTFKVNRQVCQGVDRYLDVRVDADIAAAYAALRADGFAIYATDLKADAVLGPQRLAPIMAERGLAIAFGSESTGLSPAGTALANGCVLLPMAGFTQSLNLSVSVATTLYALRGDALADDRPGDLDPAEQCACYERWVLQHRGEAARALIERARGRHGEDLDVWRPAPG